MDLPIISDYFFQIKLKLNSSKKKDLPAFSSLVATSWSFDLPRSSVQPQDSKTFAFKMDEVKQEPNGIIEQKEEAKPVQVRAPARPSDEDAAQLELGPEFDESAGAQPLFISEVAHLLTLQVESKRSQDGEAAINPVLMKSLEYTLRFKQLESTQEAISMRAQLHEVQPQLHAFEIAQLASLMPKEAEEAKAIIPSLGDRYDDDVLNEILKNMDAWL